jgi:hypothetical protein
MTRFCCYKRCVMHVRVVALRSPGGVEDLLRADGWRVLKGEDGALSASHPEIMDQQAARNRLLDLGLLTSGAVRIDFGLPRN